MTNDDDKPLIKNHQGKLRPGRGWSYGEVKSAKLKKEELRLHSLQFDKRRKTIYKHNVKKLEKLIEQSGPK
jgi:ribosomal protein L13E